MAFAAYAPANATGPTVNHTASASAGQCTLTVSTSGDIVLVGTSEYDAANNFVITGIAGTLGDSSYAVQTSSTVVQMTIGGLYLYSFIYSGTTTSSGTDTITISYTGTLPQFFIYCLDTSGLPSASATVAKNAKANQAAGTPATGSASYSSNNILLAVEQSANGCAAASNPTISGGSGYTFSQNGAYEGSQYKVTASSSTTTFAFGTSCNTGYGISGAVFGSAGTSSTVSPSAAISLSAAVMKSVTLLASKTVVLSAAVQKSETLQAATSIALSANVSPFCNVGGCHGGLIDNKQVFALLLILSLIVGFAVIGVKVSKRN